MKQADPELLLELIRRNEARDGLLGFARYTHPCWKEGTHHGLICNALEALAAGRILKLMVEAPPRHTKTELASRRFPAWYLGHNPTDQIIITTYADDLARDNGHDVLDIMRDPTYGHVFADVRLADDAQAAGRWRTAQGGIYFATGIGGAITGRGFHVGIIDDPYKSREEADSPRMREIVWRWYWGTFDTRAMPGARRLVMTTRWREDDICGRLLDLEGWITFDQFLAGEQPGTRWVRLALPAISNEGSDQEQALWPDRYDLGYMQAKRDDLRRAGRGREWNAQYQQRPTAEEGTYVLRAWFVERWKTKNEKGEGGVPEPYHCWMASDLAVTEPREGADPDYTEHGVFVMPPDGKLYVVDWWYGQTTAEKWIESAFALVRKWKPLAWFAEGGVIRRATEPLISRISREQHTYVNIQWVNPIADKATRGRAFQAWSSMGRVIFQYGVPWAERVIDQCCDFPGGRKDDAFDACSTMCSVIDSAHPAVQPTQQRRTDEREWVSGTTRSTTVNSWMIGRSPPK